MRVLSAAIRMSQSRARSKDPPITQPFIATRIGAGMLKKS